MFKTGEFEIKEEDAHSQQLRVVKTEKPMELSVQSFNFNRIGDDANKPRQRPAQAPDAQKKDQRFVLSQLAREAISAGKEEERLLEQMVSERVYAISAKAKEEGFHQGHAEGTQKGHDEALKQFQAEATERLGRVDSLLAEIESAKTEIFKRNEEFLVGLFYRIAKIVLLRESSTDRDYLLRLATELIEKTGLRENLTFKIHPKDAASMDSLREGLLQKMTTLKNLGIEVSETAREGGCILETEWGAIDASLETQLAQILKSLDQKA